LITLGLIFRLNLEHRYILVNLVSPVKNT
jgi:hypothetical protein